jgi:carboxypeptidase Taq
MSDALTQLRARIAELADLGALSRLLAWDQRTMMPPEGAPARAQQVATLERITHDLGSDEQVGAWLEAIEADGAGLEEVDADVVRLARRDYDLTRRIPTELATELARAGAEGQDAWQAARAADDFPAFVPALRRNVELARELARHLDPDGVPYDALLSLYDNGLTSERVGATFARLAQELPEVVDAALERPVVAPLTVPVEAQQAAVEHVLARVGVTTDGWRVDVSAHPFTAWAGPRDTRVTTRYEDGQLESVLAALHEFGHGLYERQIDPALARTNLGAGTSMAVHESQSKLWENHVGRHPAFASVIAAELTAGGFTIEPRPLHAALVQVRRSLIRTSADEVTYPLHIVLRFELESALIGGTLDVAELPAAWNDGMRRLIGIEPPDDAQGVLQDVHWSAGAFGYFPSYALGCLIAAQLWEQLETDLGPQDTALGLGDVEAIRGWLADNVHRHGRRLDTEPLLEQATGRGLDPEPFLRHVRARLQPQ